MKKRKGSDRSLQGFNIEIPDYPDHFKPDIIASRIIDPFADRVFPSYLFYSFLVKDH